LMQEELGIDNQYFMKSSDQTETNKPLFQS
jgi:hypothetical protein